MDAVTTQYINAVFWIAGGFSTILTAVGAIVGLRRFAIDVDATRHRRRLDDYKFCSEFLERLKANEPLDPYLEEAGYKTIAHSKTASPDAIKYLLTLKDADLLIDTYVRLAPKFFAPYVPGQKVEFKPKYLKPGAVKLRLRLYGSGYFISTSLAVSPLFLPLGHGLWSLLVRPIPQVSASLFIQLFFLTLFAFGPTSVLPLVELAKLSRAKRFVENQNPRVAPRDLPPVDPGDRRSNI